MQSEDSTSVSHADQSKIVEPTLRVDSTAPQILSPPPASRLDILFARAANASQLGLLLLAVFGYFYTVLPVYQKALLDEEIAKKTLALASMETALRTKDSELNEKNQSLANLNAAVEKAHQSLSRSQAEVDKLRGKVQIQYSELRPRLVEEFQWLAESLCKLSSVPDLGFSNCVQTNVLPTANLVSLTEADRARLLRLVRQENESIHKSWRTFSQALEQRKAAAQLLQTDAMAKCEQQKASEDYKDPTKRIRMDYQCNVDVFHAKSELASIVIETYSGEKILSQALAALGKKFFAADNSR